MALCKGLLCISNPISATRPSGRVASSVGNSLAAAMFPLGQVTRPSFFLPSSVGDRGRRWDGIKRYQLYRDGRWVGFEDEDEYEIYLSNVFARVLKKKTPRKASFYFVH